jgi:hypothetical protein
MGIVGDPAGLKCDSAERRFTRPQLCAKVQACA